MPRHKTRSFRPVENPEPTTGGPVVVETIVLSDVMGRLGRVESNVNQILPAIGEISEAVQNTSVAVMEIKESIKHLKDRQSDIEGAKQKEIEQALAIARQEESDRKKEKREHRNSAIKYFVGGVITITLGFLAAHFGWR